MDTSKSVTNSAFLLATVATPINSATRLSAHVHNLAEYYDRQQVHACIVQDADAAHGV